MPPVGPYRTPAPARRSRGQFPAFLYDPRDRDRGPLRRLVGRLWLGVIAGSLLAASAPSLALVGLALLAVWSVWQWPRTRRPEGVLLWVENGELVVFRQPGVRPVIRVRLDGLRDVRIETRSIDKTRHEAHTGLVLPTPAATLTVDVSRVVFDFAPPDEPLLVSGEFMSSSVIVPCVGKMRVYLRRHGWLPEDERAETRPERLLAC
jgi:hypothetical protein